MWEYSKLFTDYSASISNYFKLKYTLLQTEKKTTLFSKRDYSNLKSKVTVSESVYYNQKLDNCNKS